MARVEYLLDNYSSDEVQQLSKQSNGYYDKGKFLVSFGIVEKRREYHLSLDSYSEYSIQSCDGMYRSYSGFSFIIANSGLFHEKQLTGHKTLECALLDFGLLILKKSKDKKKKKYFMEKYVFPYNRKLHKEMMDKLNKNNEVNNET